MCVLGFGGRIRVWAGFLLELNENHGLRSDKLP